MDEHKFYGNGRAFVIINFDSSLNTIKSRLQSFISQLFDGVLFRESFTSLNLCLYCKAFSGRVSRNCSH